MRGLLPRLAILLAILVVAPARASADGGVIALLPLAADAKLALYGQPVASEVARALEQDGFTIALVTSTSPVPSKARLVIDGRIVRGDDGVKLEARVRDPRIGAVVAELSAAAPSLTRIDEAAAALAASLAPVLRDGLARQDAAAAAAAAPPPPDATSPTAGAGEPAVPADPRPLASISLASTAHAGADDPAPEPLLRAGAIRLADLVGYRATDAADAALSIHVDLLEIRYRDGGVITARARARVTVRDAAGVVFDRVVRTDTLVGGRGDRRDAVARAAVDEIVDIAMPRVREQLAARAEATR